MAQNGKGFKIDDKMFAALIRKLFEERRFLRVEERHLESE
jgi:hypothetical protein